MKKSSVSSLPAGRHAMNADNTKVPDSSDDELRRLSAMPEDAIDTSDIPEVQDWSKAERGRFHRPGASQNIPLYLDSDIVEFLTRRARTRGLQPHDLANEMLRRDIELVRSVEA